MCARPRKVTDDDVFMAAYRVMSRVGPNDLTLGHIATEAGVTAGLLVQRFGSKRELLLKLSERFSAGTAEMFTQLRQRHRSPVAVLRAYAECMAGLAETPEALMRSLAYLQIDLTDQDFRKNFSKSAKATREELQRLVREAIDAGELSTAANPKQLSRTIEAVIGGSMLSWAHYQEGSAAKWIRDDLNAVLKPYTP
jgi:AcrR family transcriptional regulator